jgi:hypothetical protein
MNVFLPPSTKLDLVSELEALKINRAEFAELLEGAFSPISKGDLIELDYLLIPDQVFSTQEELLSVKMILCKVEEIADKAIIALTKRAIIAGIILRLARKQAGSAADIRSIWPMLYSSICPESELPIIASLGSQGFLSIPLYFKGSGSDISSILRLHFWHESMFKEQGGNQVHSSIHSHRFHATSWVLEGNITDTSYDVSDANDQTGYCFFDLKWQPSKSASLNENKSVIENSGVFADVIVRSVRTYQGGQSYEIDCGVYHSSFVHFAQDGRLLSTLFLFDAQKGMIERGGVVGPANVRREETIRQPFTNTDTYHLIDKLNGILSQSNE